MLNDLEIIMQLDKKIQQLPPQFLGELERYVDFLLQKSRIPLPTTQQLSLQRQQEILRNINVVWDENDQKAIVQVQQEVNQWKIETF